MDRISLATTIAAGTKFNEAGNIRAPNRMPVKQAPLPEPAEAVRRDSRPSAAGGIEMPISLNPTATPTVQADGRLKGDEGRGTVLHVLA
jgi:hypothetical protein